MPCGDGTGPRGMGSSIGRGLGFCGRAGVPGAAGGFRRPGLACRMGWGAGRGWYAAGAVPVGPVEYTAEEERRMLSARADMLRKALDDIEARLGSLEAQEGSADKS